MPDLETGTPPTGTAAAAPASTAAPATTTPPTAPTPNYAAATPPAGSTPAAEATPPAKKFEYTEDRGNWIPPHRMSKAAEERQQALAEAAVLRRQMAAITGVTPPDPADAERAELRKALGSIDPRLEKFLSLPEDALDRLLGFVDHIPNVTATLDRYWNSSVQSTLDAVGTQFDQLGIKVSMSDPDDAEIVRGSLVSYIKADRTGARAERFENGDPTVLSDFAKYFHSKFVGGPRAAATTSTARELEDQRRRLPTAGPRTSALPTTDAVNPTNTPRPGSGTVADRRALHSRARAAYLERTGARS